MAHKPPDKRKLVCIPLEIIDRGDLDYFDKRVYGYIYAEIKDNTPDERGYVRIVQKDMLSDLKHGMEPIIRSLRKLQNLGLIKIEKRGVKKYFRLFDLDGNGRPYESRYVQPKIYFRAELIGGKFEKT